jgi:formylglycine-generating enzyme required for sulfatase activity
MEYATRAGAVTSRYFGETDELLPKYAWYNKNAQEKPWPVGILKPNDLGFFDMHGNVFSWCQDTFKAYSAAGKGDEVVEDHETGLVVTNTVNRMLRGGSYIVQPSVVRSAYRSHFVFPSASSYHFGFRVARTFPITSLQN